MLIYDYKTYLFDFTFIELLLVVGQICILQSVILFNNSSSDILLKAHLQTIEFNL